ncbi:alpha/beta hydrolase [Stieleria varia]|uniref:Alpha/beta hydrolase family protein n=1 Tax=Stieleria varia TaxID=2528005 RepID=A0A5C6B8K6_9BACT|nr:alpha/beta hydrolase [Stieleria varia]TWU07629.1 Alpha/beta hydrolase family protein [Stieleria varia]
MPVAVQQINSVPQQVHHVRSLSPRVMLCLFVAAIGLTMVAPSGLMVPASAQAPPAKTKKEKPKPRPVKLRTKDGLELQAFYFPSDLEKKAIPVLLIHEWQGQPSPYVNLVKALNAAGCAVLVPQYRGHGNSKTYIDASGKEQEFNVATMNKRDIQNIIMYDLEEAKRFLKEENNEGKLNLNALCVIGVREGCVLAANWAQRDWRFPSVGSKKQGQDVKALVLISPEKLLKGIPIDPPLSDPNLLRLPTLIVSGQSSPSSDTADRIHKRLKVVKTKLGGGTLSGLEEVIAKESLDAPALVMQSSTVVPAIVKFVTTSIEVDEFNNPWIDRP